MLTVNVPQDFNNSLEERMVREFLQHIETEFNLLVSQRPDTKLVKTHIILNNGSVFLVNQITFKKPNTIKCTTYDKNSSYVVLSHYTNCQFFFSVEDKINENEKEMKPIGFGRNDD